MWNFWTTLFGESGDVPPPPRVPTQRVTQPAQTTSNHVEMPVGQQRPLPIDLSTLFPSGPSPLPRNSSGRQPAPSLIPSATNVGSEGEDAELLAAIQASMASTPSHQVSQSHAVNSSDDAELQAVIQASREEHRTSSLQRHKLHFQSFCQKLQLSTQMIESLMSHYADYIEECRSTSTFKEINFEALGEAFDAMDEVKQANLSIYFLQELEAQASSFVNQFNLFVNLCGYPTEALERQYQSIMLHMSDTATTIEPVQSTRQEIDTSQNEEEEDETLLAKAIALSKETGKEAAHEQIQQPVDEKSADVSTPIEEPKVTPLGRQELGRIRAIRWSLSPIFGDQIGEALEALHAYANWNESLPIDKLQASLQKQETLVDAFKKCAKDRQTLNGFKEFIKTYPSEAISPALTTSFNLQRKETEQAPALKVSEEEIKPTVSSVSAGEPPSGQQATAASTKNTQNNLKPKDVQTGHRRNPRRGTRK